MAKEQTKKTKVCPVCGKEIGKSVKRCPFCDAKQKRKLKIWQIVLIVVIAFGIIGLFGDSDDDSSSGNKGSGEVKKEKETEIQWEEVTATDIITLLDENAAKCQKKYDGKNLAITGTVDEVAMSIAEDLYISLKSKNSDYTWTSIRCFSDDDKILDQMAELKKGDKVTVYGSGKCQTDALFDITIDHFKVKK